MMIAAQVPYIFFTRTRFQHLRKELHVQGVAGEKQEDIISTHTVSHNLVDLHPH